jgi:hypothetical protein
LREALKITSPKRWNWSEQLKEIARLTAEGALTESEFEAVKARLLGRSLGS